MKKLIALLLVLILGVTMLAGCGGDDKSGGDKSGDNKGNAENATLYGEWEYMAYYIYAFNEDGTGYAAAGELKNEFTYEDKDGTLFIDWIFEGQVYDHDEWKYSIKGQEMTVEDTDGSVSVYTKK